MHSLATCHHSLSTAVVTAAASNGNDIPPIGGICEAQAQAARKPGSPFHPSQLPPPNPRLPHRDPLGSTNKSHNSPQWPANRHRVYSSLQNCHRRRVNDAGSRFETDETNGTAHFLERMLFKGTDRRSARELEEEIENMGGHLNAYTSRLQTAYHAKVIDKDVPRALDILSDILQNSRFDERRITRDRDVILREMEEVEGQTEEVIFDHLHATAFQYTPLGRTILGPAENIKTIEKEQLQNYISTHYTAPRMIVAASGAVKHEDIVEQVKKLFTKLSTDPTTASELVAKEPAIFTGSEIRMLDDDIPLAQFAVAFEGASWTDPDSIALMVMQSMLGSWNKNAGGGKHMGSELAQRVGINEIAESMMAFNTNYKDTGLFGVYAVAKPDCLDDLAYAIMYEITKFCYRVSEADVIRARNQLKPSLLLHIDGTSPVAEDIGRQLLTYGRRIPYAELFARIDSVDTRTVKRVATDIYLMEALPFRQSGLFKAYQTITGSGAELIGSAASFSFHSN